MRYDVALLDAEVIDPENVYGGCLSVYLADGKIAAVTHERLDATEVYNCAGLTLCPGFIDPHCHNDGVTTYTSTAACALQSLRQGVTGMINGNCGLSVTRVAQYLSDANGQCVNSGELIGASTLRVMCGITDRYAPSSHKQQQEMCAIAREAMQEGALGLSFGLGYVPGISTEEAVTLAHVAAQYSLPVAIDTRMEGPHDLLSLKQAIEIGRLSGADIIVSHFVYQYGEGIMDKALELMESARREGLRVSADSGMYVHWATGVGSEMFRESFIEEYPEILSQLVVATGEHKGCVLDRELYVHLRALHPDETMICRTGIEESIFEAFTAPYMMLSSDTAPYPDGEGHPQTSGSFARFFRTVRERGYISLEDAVKRCTLLPAQAFGLEDRGRMRVGCAADIAVFDPRSIRDRAAFCDIGMPDAPPIGVEYVFVNGKASIVHGEPACLTAGAALRL